MAPSFHMDGVTLTDGMVAVLTILYYFRETVQFLANMFIGMIAVVGCAATALLCLVWIIFFGAATHCAHFLATLVSRYVAEPMVVMTESLRDSLRLLDQHFAGSLNTVHGQKGQGNINIEDKFDVQPGEQGEEEGSVFEVIH